MSSLLRKLGELDRLREARGTESSGASFLPVGSSPRSASDSFRLQEFAEVATDDGPLHVRMQLGPVGRRVGHVTLGEALSADARLLARLGLAPEVEGLPLEGALFLDTETSGLGGGTGNRAFLVGLAYFDAGVGAFVLEQLLLREPDDESAILEQVRRRLVDASFVVTYNGKSFDLPVLRARASLSRLAPLPELPHLDLLHVARRIHDRRGWRLNLGVVERQVLGFDRGPDIPGEEVALRYAEYLFTGDESSLAAVVDHNRHDVWTLVALLGHYGRTDDERLRRIEAPELSGMARVLRRAGDLDWAGSMADRAVACAELLRSGPVGASGAEEADALWTRFRIAKSRGEKAAAMADLERIVAGQDDPDARLELAKLYEHFAKDPSRALELAEQGTGELPSDLERRRARLRRKITGKRP